MPTRTTLARPFLATVTAVTAATAAAGLVLALAVPARAATATDPPLVPGHVGAYVALGDSFTAGPLIPLQRLDPLGCARSTSNYPAVLAVLLRVSSFRDASCSGAATANMYAPQAVPLGSNPAQLDAVTPDTDLVTLGIGGNDFSLYSTLIGCTDLYASDPQGAPCRARLGDSLDPVVAAIGERVGKVVDAVHARAPHARVVVVGYLRIAPSDRTCQDVLPLAAGDYPFLDGVEHSLDDTLATAARGHGAAYVDSYAASAGHDVCAGDRAWVNGKDLKLLAAAPYHPYFSGMAGVGLAAYRTLTGTAPATSARDVRATLRDGVRAGVRDGLRDGLRGDAGDHVTGHRTKLTRAEHRAVRRALHDVRADLRRAGLRSAADGTARTDRAYRRAVTIARVCHLART